MSYSFDFSDDQWEELESLGLEIGQLEGSITSLPRVAWMQLAMTALGKAQLIDEGRYDMGDEDDEDNPEWAAELREIARVILDKFQPGDGQI